MNERNMLFYVATLAGEVRAAAPPDVVALCAERTCHRCRRPVLVIRREHAAARAACRAMGIKLRVVCHGCRAPAAREQGWPENTFRLELADAEVTRRLARHEAEKN
jgi:hypothetical protein